MANYRKEEEYSADAYDSSANSKNSYLSNARSILSIGRQKILNAVESSKEQGFLSSIPKGITQSFSYDESTSSTQSAPIVPDDAKIQLFKSYSRATRHGYTTNVKGLLYCDGVMNRRNRLLYSLIQKLAKPNVSSEVGSMITSELEDALVNQDSLGDGASTIDSNSMITHSSSSSSNPGSAGNGNPALDIVKDRMRGIMARTIGKAPIRLSIGTEEKVDSLMGANFTTDNSGYFEFSIATPYRPSFAMVASLDNSSIMVTENIEVIEENGVSVITDIDDTIRVTGVLKDKREMIRNVFSKDFIDCEIPGLSEWYNMLNKEKNCSIHYVSNSPWQIYNIVSDFMDFLSIPSSSIHLRQYSGNLISSFTQPSGERKKGSLVKIIKDFPSRKFILIGDSGEQDIEAYLSIAKEFPDNVLAIYIRAMEDAFSLIDNMRVFQELEAKLLTRDAVYTSVHALGTPEAAITHSGLIFDDRPFEDEEVPGSFHDESSIAEEVQSISSKPDDQSAKEIQSSPTKPGSSKLKPIIPAKPKALKGETLLNSKKQSITTQPPPPPPPQLPSRRSRQPDETPRLELKSSSDDANKLYIQTPRQRIPPPLPARSPSARSTSPVMRSATYPLIDHRTAGEHSHVGGGWDLNHDLSEEEDYTYGTDKRRELWRERINRVLMELPPSVDFKFWWTVDDVIIDSLKLCDKVNETKKDSKVPSNKEAEDVKEKKEPENLIDL